MSKKYNFDTLSLHAGQTPDEEFGSRAVPIHQTTSYVFRDTRHAAALYNMEIGGHLYSRISNPTVAVLEQRVAALDDAVARFEDGLLDSLCIVFLSFVPENNFSSVVTDTSELPEIIRKL